MNYFLVNRKGKSAKQLTHQLQLFCIRKQVPVFSKVQIDVYENNDKNKKYNLIKITIN